VRWVSVHARALFEGRDVTRIAGTVIDISERKLVDEALREREQLRASDRRKDEWIAMLAHELRNPLAPLRLGLEVLRLLPAPPAEATAMYDIMQNQLVHIARLVDDLLDISRIAQGKVALQRSPASLAAIVRIALDAIRGAIAERDLALHVRVDEALVVDVDAARMVQVFSNLLHNAAKFTPPRGRIDVVARRVEAEVVVAVSDTGTGIPADLLPHIFELFTQGPRVPGSQSGLGIGLALARQLVELHGGRITARSDGPGRGAELTVRLPLASVAIRAPASADPTAPQELARTVLIVEDNEDVAAALAMLVKGFGGAPHVAYDGESALERLAELHPGVVLLDIGLPGLDGYDTCRRIRSQLGGAVQVIALTGWGSAQDKQRAAEAGFDAHLTKPPDPAELRRYLFGRAPGERSGRS
jgi:CheY-like chemotaxis protein